MTSFQPGQKVGEYTLVEPRLINDIPCWRVHHVVAGVPSASTLPEWLLFERAK